MKFGLHLPHLTYPGGPSTLGPDLARIAAEAEDAGYDRLSVMDHFWQIGHNGPPESDMLECWTALGFLAGHTSRVSLYTLVSSVVYREPAVIVKSASTLDVLSGGRAMLGIGAGWFEAEAQGLGLPFPPVAERFERLDEALQIALRMWSDSEEPFRGTHYSLDRPLNVPQPLTRPRPRIVIGGGGERKTLRLVAKYADVWNWPYTNEDDLLRKLTVLREHCEREGRDFDEIEKSVHFSTDVGPDGGRVQELVDFFRRLGELGVGSVTGRLKGVHEIAPIRIMGDRVIPAVTDF